MSNLDIQIIREISEISSVTQYTQYFKENITKPVYNKQFIKQRLLNQCVICV